MIPNKKTVNTKSQSPWMLCPSTSFPGKFYYFNGATGETAWSLSDNEKFCRKDTIHKVTDRNHTYPEPLGPPNDESTNTNTSNSLSSLKNIGGTEFGNNVAKQAPWYHIPTPSFGQAVFPTYSTPEILTPKFVWTLTPMYVPDQQPQRQMFHQITQPYKQNQPIFTQTSPVTLNNQFQPMNRNLNYPGVFQFGQNHSAPQHFQKEKPMFGQASFNAFRPKEMHPFSGKPQIRDQACQTFEPTIPTRHRTRSVSNTTPTSTLKPGRSVENLTSLFTKDVETSTESPPRKVDNEKTNKLSELDKNDLRFLLVAKKSKVELGDTSTYVEDKPKPYNTQDTMVPRKRVTFDLHMDTSSEDTPEIEQSPGSSQQDPRQLAPSSGHEWYVVADTEALLTDFQCIEQYVKRDSGCRLLVPCGARAQLAGRARGRGGAPAARQLLRRLVSPSDYIDVQTDIGYEYESPEDNILQCCWNLLQENYRVILITDNKKMLNEAKHIDLKCFTLDEIKNSCHPLPLPQIDLKKVNKVVNNEYNDDKKSKNLFMQHFNEIKEFNRPRINASQGNRTKMNFNDAKTNCDKVFCKKVGSDKLINLTKSKKSNSLNSEISKLSIADNNNIQNKTKLIMKKVFQNTEIDQNARNLDVLVHEKENYKLTNFKYNSVNKNLENVPRELDVVDEIDQPIGRLNLPERNAEKNRDTTKVSGITKLNSQFDLDEKLKRFRVKDVNIENRIKSRFDEWMCRLRQIMESALTDVLLKEKAIEKGVVSMPSHKYRYLYEPIQRIGKTFQDQRDIKMIVDRLLNLSTSEGDLTKNMKSNDFLKLFGLSKILLQKMKYVVHYEELYEAEDMLDNLIRNIEDPKTDVDLALEQVHTPFLSRSEISQRKDVSFRKSEQEIIDYLKKHFDDWNKTDVYKHTEVAKTKICDNKPNIVRTCGKNLNLLKIYNTKAISIDKNESPIINNNNVKINASETLINNENTVRVNASNGPKIIRNVKIIEAFEEKLKNKANLDLDDYYESEYTQSSDINYDDASNNIEATKSREDLKTKDLSEYPSIVEEQSASVSSTDTECFRAYPLAKIFLVRIKETLLQIFNFINKIIREYQDGMPTDRKEQCRLKLKITRQHILKLIERLKKIKARESGDGTTLKDLLIKAGDYVEGDPIINNYQEIIAKFLQQADILEDAITTMLPLFNGSPKDRDTRYCTNALTCNASSPTLPTPSLRTKKLLNAP